MIDGKKEFNKMNSNKMVEEWEDKLWNLLYEEYGDVGQNGNIKNFISSLLSLQKTCTLEEVEEIIWILRNKGTGEEVIGDPEIYKNFNKGRHQAFSDLLAKLTSLKQDSGEIKK